MGEPSSECNLFGCTPRLGFAEQNGSNCFRRTQRELPLPDLREEHFSTHPPPKCSSSIRVNLTGATASKTANPHRSGTCSVPLLSSGLPLLGEAFAFASLRLRLRLASWGSGFALAPRELSGKNDLLFFLFFLKILYGGII